MTYKRVSHTNDSDIPYLTSVLRLPEISRFIRVDEERYWEYVTTNENVFYFKAYHNGRLSAATHCEVSGRMLYMDIMVIPQYQRQGIATEIVRDIQCGNLAFDFDTIEVAIDESNVASIGLFEKMGFSRVSKEDELITYVYHASR